MFNLNRIPDVTDDGKSKKRIKNKTRVNVLKLFVFI